MFCNDTSMVKAMSLTVHYITLDGFCDGLIICFRDFKRLLQNIGGWDAKSVEEEVLVCPKGLSLPLFIVS